MEDFEKKNSRIGLLTSIGVHAGIFLLLFFLVAWRAPNPPLPEFGIELNFGLDDQGSGDVQPETPVGDENPQNAEEIKEQPADKQPEQTQETQEEAKTDVVEQPVEQIDSKIESPVVLKEEKKVIKTEPVKEKPFEKTVETKPKEQVVAEYKKPEATDDKEAAKKGTPGTQGDDKGKTGDKGSPQGKLDAKALYGTPGGGGGGNGMDLQMSGWAWAEEPKIPELPDNENGRVEFEIECDESGDITGITTLVRSLSPRAEQILKDEIRKNSLIRTSGGKVPPRSKGKIIFVLRTR